MADRKQDKQKAGAPGGTAESNTSQVDSGDGVTISVSMSGPAHLVRRAFTALRFDEQEWNPSVTRKIAIDKTLVDGVTVFDQLGGRRLQMVSQDDRDLYHDRCIQEAEDRGHKIADGSKIPAKEKTTVGEVGDALFNNSKP